MWGRWCKPGDLVAELDPQPQQDALRPRRPRLPRRRPPCTRLLTTWSASGRWLARAGPPGSQYDASGENVPHRQGRGRFRRGAVALRPKTSLATRKLLADSSGAVITTGAEAGEVVRAGQTIVTVAQHDGADAVFDVPASLMRQMSPDVRDQHRANRRSDHPYDRPGAGNWRRRRTGDPKLPGQGRAGRLPASHAAGRDGDRADAHGRTGRHRAAGDRADDGGQQAGRLGGRSRNSASVAATRRAATPGLFHHRRDSRASKPANWW